MLRSVKADASEVTAGPFTLTSLTPPINVRLRRKGTDARGRFENIRSVSNVVLFSCPLTENIDSHHSAPARSLAVPTLRLSRQASGP